MFDMILVRVYNTSIVSKELFGSAQLRGSLGLIQNLIAE